MSNLHQDQRSSESALDVVLVMGGATYKAKVSGRTQLGPSGDRLLYAFNLVQSGIADKLYLLGGVNVGDNTKESMLEKEVLISWGVQKDKLHLETQSTNTYENAQFAAQKWPDLLHLRVGVVTSIEHMDRALWSLCSFGIHAHSFPANIPLFVETPNVFSLLVPKLSNFATNARFLREKVGLLYYKIRYGASSCQKLMPN